MSIQKKHFKDLFGCDSDEENIQTKSSSTSDIKKDNLPESYNDKNKTKHEYRNQIDISKYRLQNNHYRNNNAEPSKLDNGKRLNSAYESDKKRIKKQHIQEIDKKIHETITNSIKGYKLSSLTETKCSQNNDVKQKEIFKKTEIGKLVVKLLTPAYIEKRFESRDTFKMLARNISHALYDKGEDEYHLKSMYWFLFFF